MPPSKSSRSTRSARKSTRGSVTTLSPDNRRPAGTRLGWSGGGSAATGRALPRVGRSRENRPENVHAEELTLYRRPRAAERSIDFCRRCGRFWPVLRANSLLFPPDALGLGRFGAKL